VKYREVFVYSRKSVQISQKIMTLRIINLKPIKHLHIKYYNYVIVSSINFNFYPSINNNNFLLFLDYSF
jgi:hypothetical protein